MSDHDLDPRLVDLADVRLGGAVLACNDEFFAPAANLLRRESPVWDEQRFTDHGKWMDGWETRRRRDPGHDWCILALGIPGVVEAVVVDTTHFRGNHPAACSLDLAYAHGLDGDALAESDALWTEVLSYTPLLGHEVQGFRAQRHGPATHARLRIHPDGGVARLRLLGRARPEIEQLVLEPASVDLSSLALGGRVLGCSDAFFSAPSNLLQPTRSRGMHDGWETQRRRGPGHDFVVVELGVPGSVERIEVDTSHFKGNAPAHCVLSVSAEDVPAERYDLPVSDDGPWRPLLEHGPLQPDTLHVFDELLEGHRQARMVRFEIHPDGGVARLRVRGRPIALSELDAGMARLDALPDAAALDAFYACCGSAELARALVAERPFGDPTALCRRADELFVALGEPAWREAFASHPAIGEPAAGRDRSARWSSQEQAAAGSADATVRKRLAQANLDYRERFGLPFIVCATGRSSAQMLALATGRLRNDAASELTLAVAEQRRIATLRLCKLLGET